MVRSLNAHQVTLRSADYEANLKGHRIGGVEVSTKHAGFMVNVDHGTAKDYEDLIADVIAKVKENSGVTLEPEVRIIGDKLN